MNVFTIDIQLTFLTRKFFGEKGFIPKRKDRISVANKKASEITSSSLPYFYAPSDRASIGLRATKTLA